MTWAQVAKQLCEDEGLGAFRPAWKNGYVLAEGDAFFFLAPGILEQYDPAQDEGCEDWQFTG